MASELYDHTDALAEVLKIAVPGAEIARLRDALQGIADCAMSGSMFEELALDALFAAPTKDK